MMLTCDAISLRNAPSLIRTFVEWVTICSEQDGDSNLASDRTHPVIYTVLHTPSPSIGLAAYFAGHANAVKGVPEETHDS